MGVSSVQVPFFSPDMKLDVHTASLEKHLTVISLGAFAKENTLSLEKLTLNDGSEEFLAKTLGGRFIQGILVN